MYIGGDFDTVDNQKRSCLACVNLTTGHVNDWNPDIKCSAARQVKAITVNSLAINGNDIYAGGMFDSVGDQPRKFAACIDATTGLATGWNPDIRNSNSLENLYNFPLHSIIYHQNKIYVCGDFDSVGDSKRNGLACLDATTGTLTNWNPEPRGSVYALFADDNGIYTGGLFDTIGGQLRNNIACINNTDGKATSWNPGTNRYVNVIVKNGNCVAAGGLFSSIGGKTRKNIACLDAVTGRATDWDPQIVNSTNSLDVINAIAVSGNKVYIGGKFSYVGGKERNCLVCIDALNGVVTDWNPNPKKTSSMSVYAILVNSNNIYIGGYFDTIGGKPRKNIACIDSLSGLATDWNPSANTTVFGFSLIGNNLFICGDFDTVCGLNRKYLACLDITTGIPTSWNPEPNNGVRTIVASDNRIYAGGKFTPIGGQNRNSIACIDATSGLATEWIMEVSDCVSTIGISRNNLFYGGFFAGHMACVDTNTGLATDWRPFFSSKQTDFSTVYTISISDKHLFFGGAFDIVSEEPFSFIAQFNLSSSPVNHQNNGKIPHSTSLRISGKTIEYSISRKVPVSVKMFMADGSRIASLDYGMREPGTYLMHAGFNSLSTGFYLIQLKAGNDLITKRYSLIR